MIGRVTRWDNREQPRIIGSRESRKRCLSPRYRRQNLRGGRIWRLGLTVQGPRDLIRKPYELGENDGGTKRRQVHFRVANTACTRVDRLRFHSWNVSLRKDAMGISNEWRRHRLVPQCNIGSAVGYKVFSPGNRVDPWDAEYGD